MDTAEGKQGMSKRWVSGTVYKSVKMSQITVLLLVLLGLVSFHYHPMGGGE